MWSVEVSNSPVRQSKPSAAPQNQYLRSGQTLATSNKVTLKSRYAVGNLPKRGLNSGFGIIVNWSAAQETPETLQPSSGLVGGLLGDYGGLLWYEHSSWTALM